MIIPNLRLSARIFGVGISITLKQVIVFVGLLMLIGSFLFWIPNTKAAALNYEQSFDTLTDADLHGQDSWLNENDPVYANAVVQSNVYYLGSKGLKLTGYASYKRTISADTGFLYYAVRVDATSTGDGATIQMRTAGQYNTIVKFEHLSNTLKVRYYSNGAYSDWQTTVVGVWNIIGIELDQPNNRYRLNWNGSAFGSWVTQGTSGAAAPDRLRILQDSGWVSYIDEFSTTYPEEVVSEAATSSISSVTDPNRDYFYAVFTVILSIFLFLYIVRH